MASLQEALQSAIRAQTNTALSLEGDIHALCDLSSIPKSNVDARLLALLQANGSAVTNATMARKLALADPSVIGFPFSAIFSLVKDLFDSKGGAPITMSRASTSTVMGYAETANAGAAQQLLTVAVNVPVFSGARGIGNPVTSWSDTYADGTPILPIPRARFESGATNLLLNSAVLATQTVTLAAGSNVISLWGTGSVTLSGSATGTLNGTGVNNRVQMAVTATAGACTVTVTGSCTNGQFQTGTIADSYIPTTTAEATRAPDYLPTTTTAGRLSNTEGSVYFEFVTPSVLEVADKYLFGNITIGELLALHTIGAVLYYRKMTGGVDSTVASPIAASSSYKCIATYGALGMQLVINGALVVSNAVTTGYTVQPSLSLNTYASTCPYLRGKFQLSPKQISTAEAIRITS